MGKEAHEVGASVLPTLRTLGWRAWQEGGSGGTIEPSQDSGTDYDLISALFRPPLMCGHAINRAASVAIDVDAPARPQLRATLHALAAGMVYILQR